MERLEFRVLVPLVLETSVEVDMRVAVRQAIQAKGLEVTTTYDEGLGFGGSEFEAR